MAQLRKRWYPERRADAYRELEHPADLFLEIQGRDLPELLENALFAFYDQIAEIQGFEARRELTLCVSESGPDETLRSLLSEALYLFDTEGFVATGGEVRIVPAAGIAPAARIVPAACRAAEAEGSAAADPARGAGWSVVARLWGEDSDRERHALLSEVKAVTYHQLEVRQAPGGQWRATVLLDV